jgi:chaperonin GroES
MKMTKSNVLIKPIDAEKVSTGGIIMPSTVRCNNKGVVIAIGDTVEDVRVGNTVIYMPNRATDVDIDGVAHVIVSEENIPLYEE